MGGGKAYVLVCSGPIKKRRKGRVHRFFRVVCFWLRQFAFFCCFRFTARFFGDLGIFKGADNPVTD